MKKLFFYAICTILVLSCSPSPESNKPEEQAEIAPKKDTQILFEVLTLDEEADAETNPWISVDNPHEELKLLVGRDDVVLSSSIAILVIDYPLENPVEIEITSKSNKGFSRGELVEIISAEYKKIYQTEESTASIKTIPPAKRNGSINRNTTNGKYGIWGHDIGDLDLSEIIVDWTNQKKPRLALYIES